MELLPLLGALVVLALVDSTSFGTLLIPVWLLMTPGRVRVARMLVYLATIAGFYLVVGLVVALGAGAFADVLGRVVETRPARVVELLLGVGLVAYSFRIDRRSKGPSDGQGRVLRWRARAMGTSGGDGAAPSGLLPLPDGGAHPVRETSPRAAVATAPEPGSVPALMGLALGAAAIELASMLPYLAAIGLLTQAGLGWPATGLVLAGYCVVMVLPALVLLAGRVLAAKQVGPLLDRLNAWMTRNAASTTAWVVGIVGFLLARDAAVWLGWMG
ncbi:GAP family protein [Oerskovia sp. NPDC060338]|uniref:GAP family protein n=1 Tax=Oerskovia sp. NPDC060338 TaxID=3347100 RepID=UPI00364C6BE8